MGQLECGCELHLGTFSRAWAFTLRLQLYQPTSDSLCRHTLVGGLVVPASEGSVVEQGIGIHGTHLNMVYASLWAGSFTFGSSRRSWIPSRI
jgi:hypothetical protein